VERGITGRDKLKVRMEIKLGAVVPMSNTIQYKTKQDKQLVEHNEDEKLQVGQE
jgi:hypothetical protein